MSSKTNLPLERAKKIFKCISSDKKFNTFESIYYNILPALKWHHYIRYVWHSLLFSWWNVCFPAASILCFVLILLSKSILWYFSLLDLKKKLKLNFVKKDYLDLELHTKKLKKQFTFSSEFFSHSQFANTISQSVLVLLTVTKIFFLTCFV